MQRSVNHRFMPGLRFAGTWQYAMHAPSDRVRWAALPMAQAVGSDDMHALHDLCGAWWCARRCTAVLQQRPWRSVQLPPDLPALPSASEVAGVLQALLPGWHVLAQHFPALAPLHCAQALLHGGCSLLWLEAARHDGILPSAFWAWVMGVERYPAPPASARPRTHLEAPMPTPLLPRTLLALPFGSTSAWPGGHPSRVQIDPSGRCTVDSPDMPWRECRWLGGVTVERAAPAGLT